MSTFDHVANTMHESIRDAAKKLNMPIATLKKLCRTRGITRWPCRKLQKVISHVKMLRKTGHLAPSTFAELRKDISELKALREGPLHDVQVCDFDTWIYDPVVDCPTFDVAPLVHKFMDFSSVVFLQAAIPHRNNTNTSNTN